MTRGVVHTMMSAHLMRFLMAFAGFLSMRTGTRHSIVSPQWLTDMMIACQRVQKATDEELESMEPSDRVAWMIEAYDSVLRSCIPEIVLVEGGDTSRIEEAMDAAFAAVREKLPQLQGDLSIDAVNKSIGLKYRD